MSDKNEIFEGKTFKDLTKDIYENARNKKKQIDLLVQEIHGMITSIDDAVMVAPIIKEYMDVSVKNDEHLVKLSSVLQRFIARSNIGEEDGNFLLSDIEKEELMGALEETVGELQDESDKIEKLKYKSTNVIGDN